MGVRSIGVSSVSVCLYAPMCIGLLARVIAFFASDDSGFMTGTYAPVNGGLAMD